MEFNELCFRRIMWLTMLNFEFFSGDVQNVKFLLIFYFSSRTTMAKSIIVMSGG